MEFIHIGNEALKAAVSMPGSAYDRRRFDWTGFITQVEYKGHKYCIPETLPGMPAGTGGIGLCSEYKTDTDMGWDDQDDLFMKPGVGILRRDNDKPYSFGYDYPLVQPFEREIRVGTDDVDFFTKAIPFKGIAYEEYKHVSVMDDRLCVTTTIRNLGENELKLREYNHNFLSMDGMGAHEDAFLSLPAGFYTNNPSAGVVHQENGITFTDEFKTSFMIYCKDFETYSPLRWELTDKKANLKVQEWGDFPIDAFMAWGMRHVISPEVYVGMEIPAGGEHTWTRMWRFFDQV